MIDKSLSRGLADRVLDQMAGLGMVYVAGCNRALRSFPRKRHSVKAVAEEMVAAGERCCLTQIVGSHPKWRWTSTCAFVPEIHTLPNCANNRTIAFRAVRTFSHVDRVTLIGNDSSIPLAIQEHAVERLFMRLNVQDAAAVREEMHDAMCLAIPVLGACRDLGLCQVVLPSRSGAFLCSLDPDGRSLVARTWIPKSDEPCRHSAVIQVIEKFHAESGGERGIAAEICSLPIDAPLDALVPAASLVRSLDRIAWLKEPYSPRPDPVGKAWRDARLQAAA